MAGTVQGGSSPFHEHLRGVQRLAKGLRNDEARAAVLEATVDQMSRSHDVGPAVQNLAQQMKSILGAGGPQAPLLNATVRTRLLQSTLEAALSSQPLGASVVLARAAVQAVAGQPEAESQGVMQSTLEQIASANSRDPNALLAQAALGGARQLPSESAHIQRAALENIAGQESKSADPAARGGAMVNEQLMFCQGKSPERIRNDLQRRLERFDAVIGTKANREQYQALLSDPAFQGKHIAFDELSQVLTVRSQERPKQGLIVQVIGGEQDLAVALEAGGIAEAMGNRVEQIRADQLEHKQELLQSANVVLTMCGNDTELPNQVAALTDKPVIATPTRHSFGEGLEGAGKLIDHMTRAAAGVSFVNIDNGFGAAYVADKINRSAQISEQPARAEGYLVVTTAGSADIPVAEKAAQAAEALGEKVLRLYDHGVNDPEGLQEIESAYRNARAVIVAAGLEGGLPNHVAAVTQSPVVAVPTSVGYGTGAGGVAAMLCALNACAPGITVVAIDAAVKAAAVAHKISARSARSKPE